MQKGDFKPQVTMPEGAEWPVEFEKHEEKPRRYEVRDAETGEKLSGVSFILTPTGEEMHLLTESGHHVGPMKDIGVYYHGHTTNEEAGNNSLPAIRPMALKWMAERIIRELANLGPHHPYYNEYRHHGNMKMVSTIGVYALARYEKYVEENAEFVAEYEREQQERRESFRKSMVAKGLMGQTGAQQPEGGE